MYSAAKPFWYSSAENALASSSNASSRLTAARVSRDRLPSDTRPTAHTTPTAATVPSDASASRIDRREPDPLSSAQLWLSHDEVVAAVLGVRLIIVPGVLRVLRAVAHGLDVAGGMPSLVR